jgi:hypothetical protein
MVCSNKPKSLNKSFKGGISYNGQTLAFIINRLFHRFIVRLFISKRVTRLYNPLTSKGDTTMQYNKQALSNLAQSDILISSMLKRFKPLTVYNSFILGDALTEQKYYHELSKLL